MRKLFLPLLLLILLTALAAPAAAIVYGELDGDRHPNVGLVSLILDPARPEQTFAYCSGTLIHPQVLLTAAHCTAPIVNAGLQPAQVKVSFDTDNALSEGLLDVVEIVTHPDFNDFRPQSNPHDVGLLILAAPVTDITPAKLPELGKLEKLQLRQGAERTKFTVVGYGYRQGESAPPPQTLPPDGKRRLAQSEYQSLHKALLQLSQNQARDNGGICDGDSGGPVFYNEDGTEILVGITSSADNVCAALGIYYRVDIADTLDFVEAQIDR